MQGKHPPSESLAVRIGGLAMVMLFMASNATFAQVHVQRHGGKIEIHNDGYAPQTVVRTSGKRGNGGWLVMDSGGNAYESQCETGCTESDPPVVTGGYQSGQTSDPDLIAGFQAVLDYLTSDHGAVITHDKDIDAYLIWFPAQIDPIGYFFAVITTEYLDGHLLLDYFRFVEVASLGTYDPGFQPAKPKGHPLSFPNDTYFRNQWNLEATGLDRAQWHPAGVQDDEVRIGIIDSGIADDERAHDGLDGTDVENVGVAPTSGFPAPHALGIVTLLGDRSQDASGVVGLLGDSWDDTGCYGYPSLLSKTTTVIDSYNVGDFGPSSFYVAKAIVESVDNGADVINLSMALANSVTVTDAIHYAQDHNVIVVAAAGNYDKHARYKPAKFPANLDGVISVGSAGGNGHLSKFSADEGVDLTAPGEDVIVGGSGNVWYEGTGTSFSAPHVVAAIAMMRAVHAGLTASDALVALQTTADRRGGYYFMDAFGAVNAVAASAEQVDDVGSPDKCSRMDKANPLVAEVDAPSSGGVALLGNYPNPFNPATSIRFEVADETPVRLSVFNVLGQEVRVLANAVFGAGAHEVSFDASALPSGVYFARAVAGGKVQHHKMLLLK